MPRASQMYVSPVPRKNAVNVEAKLIALGHETKAILPFDNCPAHQLALVSSSGLIKCVFLPANTTSLIQPQDQGIIADIKKRYKKVLLIMIFKSYAAN